MRPFNAAKSILLFLFLLPAVILYGYTDSIAQVTETERDTAAVEEASSDTLQPALQDTVFQAPADTLPFMGGDGPPGGVSQIPATRRSEGEVAEDAVQFSARDSLSFNFRGERTGLLFGSANVRHESGELSAGKIKLFIDRDEVEAQTETPGDTLSYPVLRQQNQELKSNRILFNYETERGKFEVAEISIQDGHLIGTKVKNRNESEVFIEDGIYSTNDPNYMYYYLKAKRMKVVDEEEVFFTNAQLFILDIPYPLVFPFGYVPAGIEGKQSGLLEPTYVFEDTSTRGIGLRNLGWFQYINDFLTAQTSFDLFTSGTFFNDTRLQYRKTNQYDGSIQIGFSREQGLEPSDADFDLSKRQNRRINVRHNQTLSPYANLNANIDLRTSEFFTRNSFDLDERAQTNSTSSINYRYTHPENVYNFTLNSRLNQDFFNNSTRLTGPDMNFSLRQFSPFESDTPGAGRERFYERISLDYRNTFSSDFNFRPIAADSAEVGFIEALFSPSKFREATGNDEHIQFGFRQNADVRFAQIIPSQFLNISGSFSITEWWYPSTVRKELNEEENRLETFQVRGFSTARQYNTGINFSTTIFGVSRAKIGNLEGFRHTFRPNIGFNYRPDFSSERFGFFREVQSDTLGNTRKFSIFERGILGGPSAGEQRNVSFGFSNVFETKIVKRDSTGEVNSENVRLIDNFSVNSNYNFAADSLNFGRIRMNLTSQILGSVRFRASAEYSLYARDDQGREINTFIFNDSNKILQPISYSVNLGYSFRGGGKVPRVQTPYYRPYEPFEQELFRPYDSNFNYVPVQDFSSPINVAFDFSYSWRFRFNQKAQQRAILNARNIQFNLTPKWSAGTQIGYDFIEKDLTPSQFNMIRRMEGWTLTFNFNPFGDFQYAFFRLSINSGQIQSLFQKLPGLNNLERSTSPTGRRPSRF
ncbi:MAG TPA: putative LPS assembly protein LptD [Balneolaceae bacterium]|nr:putative LPS assembly protein LptD [Balneolaceae bacterium]